MALALTLRRFASARDASPGLIELVASFTSTYGVQRLLLDAAIAGAGQGGVTLSSLGNPRSIMLDNGCRAAMIPTITRCANATTTPGAVVNAGTGLVRVTCVNHQLITGETVTIRGVQGATEVNGTWVINRIDADTFDLRGLTALTAWTTSAGSTVEVRRPLDPLVISAGAMANPWVLTTSAAHGLVVGDQVYVSADAGMTGNTIAFLGVPLIVNTVPSTTTLTLKGSRGEGVLGFTGGAFSATLVPRLLIVRTPRLFGLLRAIKSYTATISDATNADPIVVTYAPASGIKIGDLLSVSGVAGNTNANGTYMVRTVPSTVTLTMEVLSTGLARAGNAGYTSGGILSADAEVAASETFTANGVMSIPIHPRDSLINPWSGPLNL